MKPLPRPKDWFFKTRRILPRIRPMLGIAREKVRYTNNFGLPDEFVRAVINDPYSKGESDFSATGLAEPPRASTLIERHYDELEIDVSSRVASLIGQGTHSICERAARPGVDICEKRFFAKFVVDGKEYVVSAQVDLFAPDTGVLSDWKTTKAYAFSKKAGSGQKPEWINQLNIGAEILRRNGLTVNTLKIIALLKDWNQREAGTPGMPLTEVMTVELPLWDSQEATAHIEERIRLQVKARKSLPNCTSQENWGGRKCPTWCDAKAVCSQYQEMQKTGLLKKVADE